MRPPAQGKSPTKTAGTVQRWTAPHVHGRLPMRLPRAKYPHVLVTACCVLSLALAASRPARAQSEQPVLTDQQRQAEPPFAAMSDAALAMRDSIVAIARAQIGHRYRYGGESPRRGFDCSGLVRYVMSVLDVKLPRTARQQGALGLAIARDTSELLPGDLLTFSKGKRGVSHIAIYVGNGRYVHASKKAGKVIETSIDRTHSPLYRMWNGGRRIVPADDGAAGLAPATSALPATLDDPTDTSRR
jgi:cell wall-associated NlpC family hydrolase